MFPFMFVINGIPLPENHNYSIVGGAKIHIWVIDENMDSAKNKAISMVEKHLWSVQNIEYAFEIYPKQLHNLHEAEVVLYHRALRDGIAADFLAYPKVDGAPDDPVVVGRP